MECIMKEVFGRYYTLLADSKQVIYIIYLALSFWSCVAYMIEHS